MFSQPPPVLLGENEIESWLQEMFGSSSATDSGVRLVIKVDGRPLGDTSEAGLLSREQTRAVIRELTQSFQMHGGAHSPGDASVPPPPEATIRRALAVLADPHARRRTLGAALRIFGHRVTAPLEKILASNDEGPTARLAQWRERLLRETSELHLTHETTHIVRTDLARLLSDEYLAMLGENEERTLQPRLAEMAHRVLEVLGDTFHRALAGFGDRVDGLAARIARTLPASMPLRDAPSMIKQGFVSALADYLAVETSAELTGALHTLSMQYSDVVPAGRPLGFADEWFRDVAGECWNVISTYG